MMNSLGRNDGGEEQQSAAHAEEKAAMRDRHRIRPFPGQGAGDGGGGEGAGQKGVARARVGRVAGLDSQTPPAPGGGVGNHVDRADPGAEHTSAEQKIEGRDDCRAGEGGGGGHETRGQHLQQQVGVGERQRVEQQAGGIVALEDPHPGPGAEQEKGDQAELAGAAREEPGVRGEPALAGNRVASGDASCRAHGFHRESRPELPGGGTLSDAGSSPGIGLASP